MNKKQKIMLLKIISGSILLIILFFIPADGQLKLVLYLIPYLITGFDVLWEAVYNIARGQIFDENFLMSIATVGAFFTGEYPEAVFVMIFYQTGELFQNYAVGKSRESISSLMDIRPDFANIEKDGEIVQADPDEINIGDIIIIKAGEKIPLDGVVISGHSAIDTSALTGESLPRDVEAGDDVISGCINKSGLIRVRVTKTFSESTVSKILDLVENSSGKKAKTENFITKFARYYTPCVVAGAVLLAVAPPLITGGGWSEWIHRALIFLVVSCPCALVISIPLSFFGGIGGASRRGILVKGGNYLEALSRTETVVFDKTGTLTKGVFKVTAIHADGISQSKLIELAAYAENYSNHPISKSIKEAYGVIIDTSRIGEVTEIPGRGVAATIDGKTLYAGNGKLMNEQGIKWRPCHHIGTTVHVGLDGVYIGHIVISDEMKSTSEEAVRYLKAIGIKRTVMLTGDSKEVGMSVADALGLDEVHSELMPAGKVCEVERLLLEKSPRSMVVFAGDGINDAPVLSRADIGIAMGAIGSDAAIEAADIVLMDDNPSKIATAIGISKKTLRIVRQNIIFALGVKAFVLALGAFGFATMWSAVFADVGVSVIAIVNSMRALNTRKIL